MNWLLLKLLAFLLPGIDNDDDPADPADPADPDEDPADPADPDEDPADPADPADPSDPVDPDPDDEPAPRETRAQKQFRELRERAQRAEETAAAALRQVEEARRSPATPPQPSPDQVLWQQEEETLRNPETSDWQRYAIQSARQSRVAEASSRQALQRAEDMGDRADFAELAADKPGLYKAYKDRVETRLKELRARNINVPRREILTRLLGEDAMAGKLKVSDGKPPKPAPRATPRSDVPARPGTLSESEKRAKRLENIRI